MALTLEDFLEKIDGNESYIINYEGKEALTKIKEDGFNLVYVKEQTEEMCLEAVKERGYLLRYVNNQTPKICLEAVRENGMALQFVKIQTIKICLDAVRENKKAMQFVDKNIFSKNKFKKFLCKIGIHYLKNYDYKFVDKRTKKVVYSTNCECNKKWLTDSLNPLFGYRVKDKK